LMINKAERFFISTVIIRSAVHDPWLNLDSTKWISRNEYMQALIILIVENLYNFL
jgi:hypothetical protein